MLGLANSISGMPYISSSTFSIANVPDLSVWLKNAGTQTLNSGNISQWNDESGNNNHAVQTTASFQPQADGGGALLDGTDDRFNLTSSLLLTRFHLFAVLDLDTLTNQTLIGKSDNSGNFIRITDNNGYRHKARNGSETVIFDYTSGKTLSVDTKFMYEVVRSEDEVIEVFRNNGEHLNETPASGTNASSLLATFAIDQLFTQRNNSTNINGHVFEFVLFGKELTGDNLTNVRNDILTRNGL